jgi:hypothetical protein
MTSETMMSLEGIVIIALVVAAVGATVAHLFRGARSPYLITFTGSRAELIVYGVVMWLLAIGIGLAVLVIISLFASPMVGLAIFFGIEAVALDICANRAQYVRQSSPPVERARVRVTLPFSS